MSDDVLIGAALSELVESVGLSDAAVEQAVSQFQALRRQRIRTYLVSVVASTVVVLAIVIAAVVLIATRQHDGGRQEVVENAHHPSAHPQTALTITFSRVPQGFSVGAETAQRVPVSNGDHTVEYSVRLTSGGTVILVDARGGRTVQPVRRRDYLDAYPDAKFIEVGGQKVLDLNTDVSIDYQWTDADHDHVEVTPVRGGSVAQCLHIIKLLKIVTAR